MCYMTSLICCLLHADHLVDTDTVELIEDSVLYTGASLVGADAPAGFIDFTGSEHFLANELPGKCTCVIYVVATCQSHLSLCMQKHIALKASRTP